MEIKDLEQNIKEKCQTNIIDIHIKLSKDGDSYCASIGRDLQVGMASFADRPIDAIRSLCNELECKINDNYEITNLIGE